MQAQVREQTEPVRHRSGQQYECAGAALTVPVEYQLERDGASCLCIHCHHPFKFKAGRSNGSAASSCSSTIVSISLVLPRLSRYHPKVHPRG